MRKTFMGLRLRSLREQRGLTQAALAQRLEISSSYLNQLENNQRPLTVQVLLRLQARLGIDPALFSEDNVMRVGAQLQEALAEAGPGAPGPAELQALAQQLPGVAAAVLRLSQRCRSAEERLAELGDERHPVGAALQPQERVRDYFHARHNYVDELDRAAETLAQQLVAGGEPDATALIAPLQVRLREMHGVTVLQKADAGVLREFDPARRVLQLAAHLEPARQAFQLAAQLAYLEYGAELDALSAGDELAGAARSLARIGLASYFAGALLLPYRRFLAAADALEHDVELLAERFGVSVETVCHRLSTLQRREAPGLPFFFVRVDRAGNISKRQSATDFHFSRSGGTCPLWNVYQAFARPGQVLTQLASMPDARRYLWIAYGVTHRRGGYYAPERSYAVALGCDLSHAARLVYAKGLDLRNPAAVTPIGAGCKVCDRAACPQRAFPPLGQALQMDENRRLAHPYA